MTTVLAAILAGGKSRRMGQDKSLLPWEGTPLLRRVYDAAIAVADSVVVVTPWRERYQNILPDDCRWLQDRQPGAGPLVALQQVLSDRVERSGDRQPDFVWLLGCDLPQLDPDRLRNWVADLDRLPPDCLLSVPHSDAGWEPLCGFYRPAVLPHLNAFIDEGGRSFQNWLDRRLDGNFQRAIALSDADAAMLHNCNTPADLEPG